MRYIAYFTNGQVRSFYAAHIYHANRKALGIAASNKWRVLSVGLEA